MTKTQISNILSELKIPENKISFSKSIARICLGSNHNCYPNPTKSWKFDTAHELLLEYDYDPKKGSKLLAIYPFSEIYAIVANENYKGE